MRFGDITLHFRIELTSGQELQVATRRSWERLRYHKDVACAIIETRCHGRTVAVERYANQGGR